MKIRKKELSIEAVQCGEDVEKSVKSFAKKHNLTIGKKEKVFANGDDLIMLVDPNADGRDWTLEPSVWIVCIGGEFEAMPDNVFSAKYEVV